MPQAVAGVVGPEDLANDVVAHDVSQLLIKELALLVDHRVVGREVAVALADHRHRLAPPVQIPQQNLAFKAGILGSHPMRFEKPTGLKARETFVEIALAPLIVVEAPPSPLVPPLLDHA